MENDFVRYGAEPALIEVFNNVCEAQVNGIPDDIMELIHEKLIQADKMNVALNIREAVVEIWFVDEDSVRERFGYI